MGSFLIYRFGLTRRLSIYLNFDTCDQRITGLSTPR